MPNALFMLIPHGRLVASIQGFEQRELLAGLASAGLLVMLLLIRSRTNGWLALYAPTILLPASPLVVLTMLFRQLAQPSAGAD